MKSVEISSLCCPNCNAQVDISESNSIVHCEYCDSDLVLEYNLVDYNTFDDNMQRQNYNGNVLDNIYYYIEMGKKENAEKELEELEKLKRDFSSESILWYAYILVYYKTHECDEYNEELDRYLNNIAVLIKDNRVDPDDKNKIKKYLLDKKDQIKNKLTEESEELKRLEEKKARIDKDTYQKRNADLSQEKKLADRYTNDYIEEGLTISILSIVACFIYNLFHAEGSNLFFRIIDFVVMSVKGAIVILVVCFIIWLIITIYNGVKWKPFFHNYSQKLKEKKDAERLYKETEQNYKNQYNIYNKLNNTYEAYMSSIQKIM